MDGGTMQVLGDPATSGLIHWPGVVDATPTPYDLDADGVLEVVVHALDQTIYVFDATGRVVATLPTTYPAAWDVEAVLNSVAVAVMEPRAPPSIVVTNHAAYVTRWQYDPIASREGSMVFDKMWEWRMDACLDHPGMDAGPTLADLDNDGELEVLVQVEELGLYALDGDGSLLWGHCWGGGNSAPAAADLDGDGTVEAIFASDAGFISVFRGATGQPVWTFDAAHASHGVRPASIVVQPTVADLDGQLPLEILFSARHAPRDGGEDYGEFHMGLFAVRQNLTTWQSELVWQRQPAWANPMSNTRLIVHRENDSGEIAIFGMDWNTIGHRPGAWERLGPAHLFRLDAEGQDVWVRPLDAWWSNQDFALADGDGDGELEILVNAGLGHGDGLWRYSIHNGSAEGAIGLGSWKMLRGPVMTDRDGDGIMQVLMPVQPIHGPASMGALLWIDLGVPYHVAWRGYP